MRVYIDYGIGISRIDEKKTEWCCQRFYNWGHEREEVHDGGNYIGEQPQSVFNWNKLRFEKVEHSMMFGNGGFGDRFWGDKEVKVCPFCGKRITPLEFIVNDEPSNKEELKMLNKKYR